MEVVCMSPLVLLLKGTWEISAAPGWAGWELSRWDGTSGDRLVQPSHPEQDQLDGLAVNISKREDSSASLGNPFCCSITLLVEIALNGNFVCLSLRPLLLVLSLGIAGRLWLHLLYSTPKGIYLEGHIPLFSSPSLAFLCHSSGTCGSAGPGAAPSQQIRHLHEELFGIR